MTSELEQRVHDYWIASKNGSPVYSTRQIAKILGISLGFVGRTARRLGLSREPVVRLGRPRKMTQQAPRPIPRFALPTIWKTLLDLEPGECRWPFGETKPFVFCAQPTENSYCACHARIAYTRVTPLRDAA